MTIFGGLVLDCSIAIFLQVKTHLYFFEIYKNIRFTHLYTAPNSKYSHTHTQWQLVQVDIDRNLLSFAECKQDLPHVGPNVMNEI